MPAVHIQVFRRRGDDIVPVSAAGWDAFSRGLAPLPGAPPAAHGKVDLLIVTTRDGVCELVEPVSLNVDGNGYLQRLHVRFDALPRAGRVLDARSAFLRRYLEHANHWSVSDALLAKALAHLSPT